VTCSRAFPDFCGVPVSTDGLFESVETCRGTANMASKLNDPQKLIATLHCHPYTSARRALFGSRCCFCAATSPAYLSITTLTVAHSRLVVSTMLRQTIGTLHNVVPPFSRFKVPTSRRMRPTPQAALQYPKPMAIVHPLRLYSSPRYAGRLMCAFL
jgi:hypothetical protein